LSALSVKTRVEQKAHIEKACEEIDSLQSNINSLKISTDNLAASNFVGMQEAKIKGGYNNAIKSLENLIYVTKVDTQSILDEIETT